MPREGQVDGQGDRYVEALRAAIAGRCVVGFDYAGTVPSRREVWPHILGRSADGRLILSAWQVAGGSGAGWRNFSVAGISRLATTGRTFPGPRIGYDPGDRSFASTIAHL